MASRALNVVITGDAKGLGVAAKHADGHMDSLGKSGVRMGKLMAGGFAVAGAAAGGALLIGLKKSVDAAVEAEKSQARLEAQMKASGQSYRAHRDEIDKVIQKHSQLAGVDDEDLQGAFTTILRATGDVNTAMKDMGLVTDLARAKNIDLAKAGDMIAKVHAGNTGVLKRMGIEFAPITEAQDKLKESGEKYTDQQMRAAKAVDKQATSQDALAQLQRRFAGQAEAYGKTAAGAQERLGVAVENLQEKIGGKLLPVVANITGKIADFVGEMESGEGAGGRFAERVSDAFEKIKSVVGPVVKAVGGFIGEMRDGEGAGGRFRDRVSEAFGTVKQVIGDTVSTVKEWLRDHRGDINSVISAFRRVASFAKETFEETLVPVIRRSVRAVKPIIEGIASFVRGVVRTISGLLSGDWDKAWSGAKETVRGAFKAIGKLLETMGANLVEYVKDLGPKLIRGIVRGLANMGKALANGIWEGIKYAAEHVPGMAADALKDLGGAITDKIKDGFGALNPFGDVTDTMNSGFPGTKGGALGGLPTSGLQSEARSGLSYLNSTFGAVRLSSGFRTKEQNARVGGAPNSDHLTGLGTDLVPAEGWTPAGVAKLDRIAAWARKSPLIRWIGWRGVPDHGPGNHLHLSWVDRAAGDVAMQNGQLRAFGGKDPAVGDVVGPTDRTLIQSAARSGGIGADILYGVWGAESRFSHGPGPVSGAGARGPFQFMPGTAREMGVNPSDLRSSAFGAARYLGRYKSRGTAGMLAAYNAGPGGNPNNAETRAYIPRVLSFAGQWSGGGSGGGGSGGGSSSSKGSSAVGTSGVASGGMAPRVTPDFYAGPEAPSDEQQRAIDFINRGSSPVVPGTSRGQGPKKGFTQDEVERGVPEFYRDQANPERDPGPTWEEIIGADIARARLTPGKEDDIDKAGWLVWYRKQIMDQALGDADPRNDASAIEAWESATSALKSLTESVDESNRIQEQRDALNQQIADNQSKILALAGQGPAIVAAVVAAVSGGIGGQVGLGFQTPGYAGGVASYGGSAGRL